MNIKRITLGFSIALACCLTAKAQVSTSSDGSTLGPEYRTPNYTFWGAQASPPCYNTRTVPAYDYFTWTCHVTGWTSAPVLGGPPINGPRVEAVASIGGSCSVSVFLWGSYDQTGTWIYAEMQSETTNGDLDDYTICYPSNVCVVPLPQYVGC
jgi:hypothetical protein